MDIKPIENYVILHKWQELRKQFQNPVGIGNHETEAIALVRWVEEVLSWQEGDFVQLPTRAGEPPTPPSMKSQA